MNIPDVSFNHQESSSHEIQVLELEELYQRDKALVQTMTQPHRISFFNLIYIENGEGCHQIDFESYPYDSGSFIFVQKNQVHAFDSRHLDSNPINANQSDLNSRVKGKVLLFTQDFIDQALINMRLPEFTPTHLEYSYRPVVIPSDALKASCETLLTEISKELMQARPDPLISMHLFSSLFLMIRREKPQDQHERLTKDQMGKFVRFIELLEANFHQNRDANFYADQIHSTYKTLNQTCKLASNKTAKQLIDAYTILEAKRRLVIDGVSSQQLAYDLGFDDASNFVKYFKKHVLITPFRFQKQFSTDKSPD